MDEETRRAHELLERGELLLKEVRNRPQADASWPEADEPRPTRVTVPVRKVPRHPNRFMDKATEARWNEWAEGIGKREANRILITMSEALRESLGPRLTRMDAKLAALEGQIGKLERKLGSRRSGK